MKTVLTHYTAMQKYSVPDHAPTETLQEIIEWMESNGGTEKYLEKENTDDFELVDADSPSKELLEINIYEFYDWFYEDGDDLLRFFNTYIDILLEGHITVYGERYENIKSLFNKDVTLSDFLSLYDATYIPTWMIKNEKFDGMEGEELSDFLFDLQEVGFDKNIEFLQYHIKPIFDKHYILRDTRTRIIKSITHNGEV